MLNDKITVMLNNQINKEFFSWYLYLDISNYYANKNLDGFANWFSIQAQEEYAHAQLFLKYILNNGEVVKLLSIAAPESNFVDFKALCRLPLSTNCLLLLPSTKFMPRRTLRRILRPCSFSTGL
jgi:ferritin